MSLPRSSRPPAAPAAGAPLATRAAALLATLVTTLVATPAAAQPRRAAFRAADRHLVLEALDDDLVRFSWGPGAPPAATPAPSPMVARTEWRGPRAFSATAGAVETAEVRVTVAAGSLCFTVTDKVRRVTLTTACPDGVAGDEVGLTLARGGMRHVYGLGAQFPDSATADGDWLGRERVPGNRYGNRMVNYRGGQVGNAMFPIMYALGDGRVNYALFLDHPYASRWDFRTDPWRVRTRRAGAGGGVRGYVLTGPDLPTLRRDYLELVGAPPVPPKQAFGLWMSEYGFDHWQELLDRLAALRADDVPVDGFVLDLQWFGGLATNSDWTPMGSLSWDLKKFPDPRGHVARLRTDEGVGIIPIEESYVGRNLPEHDTLATRGALVRTRAGGPPAYLAQNPWWGKGGMLDWTNAAGAAFWHDWKRQPLADLGVTGHWTDLGEPEAYDSTAWYAGLEPGRHAHADVHNLYNLAWSASIADGYRRRGVRRRPFVLSRSGTSGIQRHGVAMWSGDIGGNLESLTAHLNAGMHMTLSGVDWFGTDIGGFHRDSTSGAALDELFTQWLATGAMLDVPVRVHTQNLCNCRETAPNRIGHVPSNLANLRLRYSLTPYYYTLAHRARTHGEPVVAPLVHWHQDDPAVRTMGHERLIGRDLLVALVSARGVRQRDVYLPGGTWFDFHTHARHEGRQWLRDVPVYHEGRLRLPLYARAGAIIPRMHVDARTMNVLGRRRDGSVRDELVVRVYPDAQQTRFTLHEDDGETVAYETGALAATLLSQRLAGARATVTIAARAGTYAGAPARRDRVVELVVGPGRRAGAVRVDGALLRQVRSREAFDRGGEGVWFDGGDGLVLARTGTLPADRATTFDFELLGAARR